VRGLFLFSPALKINRRAAFAKWHKLYSWLIPSAKWVGIKPDLDIYKYESFTKNAAAQTYLLIRDLDRQLHGHRLDIPVFTAASTDDMTVDASVILEFIKQLCPDSSRLVLYTTEPEKFLPDFPADQLELMNSVFPGQEILSSAHTAIMLSPEDSHYGLGGEYSNCAHYFPGDMEKYAACLAHPERNFQGEVTAQNLETGVMRRLMYNPNYDALKVSLQTFIDRLP
jgi:hypothetical protein